LTAWTTPVTSTVCPKFVTLPVDAIADVHERTRAIFPEKSYGSAVVSSAVPPPDDAAWLDADEAAAEDDETAEETDPVALDGETETPDDRLDADIEDDASPEIADETEIIEELLPSGGTSGSSSEQAETKTKPVRAQATKRPEKKLRMNTP